MMGDRETITRTARIPIKRIPTTLPDIEAPVFALSVTGQA
jgi:hypothetical protein